MTSIAVNKQWSIEARMQILMQLINRQVTDSSLKTRFKLSRQSIDAWLYTIIGNRKLNVDTDGILYKDLDFCYRGCNVISGELGIKCKIKEALGKKDIDIVPEMADEYQKHEMRALSTNQIVNEKSIVHHQILGAIPANGSIYPVRKDNGDVAGLFIVTNNEVNIAKISFAKIYEMLNLGFANQLLTKPIYHIHYQNKKIPFSYSETLIYLYLLVGKTAKEIAFSTQRSPRTVENIIANMKQKIGCFSTAGLVQVLWNNKLLSV
jgi:DNA-binding CsgD family transcriptional regulator